jgi:arginine decarboxylase
MHAAMVHLNLTNLLHQACDEEPDPVLTPSETYQKLIRNGTEKVRLSEMAKRIAGVMLVPYPPGIPVRMPGERMGGPDSPIIKLMLALEKFGKQFPGFEREVHGIEVDADGEYWMRSIIESSEPRTNGKKAGSPARNTRRRKRKTKSPAGPISATGPIS